YPLRNARELNTAMFIARISLFRDGQKLYEVIQPAISEFKTEFLQPIIVLPNIRFYKFKYVPDIEYFTPKDTED
ncbi:MAG TPA: hypothetical protein VJ044_15375, partial [Candidatus Hodarchaeales archaeon]|nr:hypothetical protein [Candidatus Hodarchaeales archaeon]